MSYLIYSANHRTHLKIVVLGLLGAILVTVVGTFAHVSDIDLGTAPLVKASHSTTVSGRLPAIR